MNTRSKWYSSLEEDGATSLLVLTRTEHPKPRRERYQVDLGIVGDAGRENPEEREAEMVGEGKKDGWRFYTGGWQTARFSGERRMLPRNGRSTELYREGSF
ncbi:hypothetical protein C8J57DRAFT_1221452 [Mycena rebaudengoi]|nr:hypothetical protein C8J57DRAFT_1221452 [Mycena rebaudengoi]